MQKRMSGLILLVMFVPLLQMDQIVQNVLEASEDQVIAFIYQNNEDPEIVQRLQNALYGCLGPPVTWKHLEDVSLILPMNAKESKPNIYDWNKFFCCFWTSLFAFKKSYIIFRPKSSQNFRASWVFFCFLLSFEKRHHLKVENIALFYFFCLVSSEKICHDSFQIRFQ